MTVETVVRRYFVLAPGEHMKYLGPRGYTHYEPWPESRAVDGDCHADGVVTYPRPLSYATCKEFELLPVDPVERAHYEFEKDAEAVGFDPRRDEHQWSYGGRRLEAHYAELTSAELRSYAADPMCFWALVLRGEATPRLLIDA